MENEEDQNRGYSLIRVRRIVSTKPTILDVSKLNNSKVDHDSDDNKKEERSIFKCCTEFFNKFTRNLQLILGVTTSIFCYYFYIFVTFF